MSKPTKATPEPVRIGLYFGALSDPLSEQLKEHGYKFKDPIDATHHQQDADAITRLSLRGIIPGSQADKARRKLLKYILDDVRPIQ